MVTSIIKWDETIEYDGGPTMILDYSPTDGKPPYIGQRLENVVGHRCRIISYAKMNSFSDWLLGKVPQYKIEVGYITEIEEVKPRGRRRKIRRIT